MAVSRHEGNADVDKAALEEIGIPIKGHGKLPDMTSTVYIINRPCQLFFDKGASL